MTEIRFYHLQQTSLENALPEILLKAVEREYKIIIKCSNKEEVEAIDEMIWTYRKDSFIPHGCKKNGFENEQPIWITSKDENVNNANMLLLINNAESELIENFDLCCKIFDGADNEILEKSREHWKEYKNKDYGLSYFQQDEQGKWLKKV